MSIPHTLMQSFDHTDCGVYAEVTAAGNIAVGDPVNGAPLMARPRLIERAVIWFNHRCDQPPGNT